MHEGNDGRGAALHERYLAERCYLSEWWNRPGDEAVSVARVRVEPGVTTRLHRLAGTTERYLILAGSGRTEVGGKTRDVCAGDVVVIPADVPQRITNTGKVDLTFLAVCTPRFTAQNYRDLENPAA